MEPYDPPEAYSTSSYNWRNVIPVRTKPNRTKKIIHGIVLGILTGAVLGLIYLNWYEAKIIVAQRHLIVEMWDYIQKGCPVNF